MPKFMIVMCICDIFAIGTVLRGTHLDDQYLRAHMSVNKKIGAHVPTKNQVKSA